MKAPKAPKPVDPYVQADAQTQSNQDSAAYNNAITHGNTYTPLGNSTYASRVDPVTGATVYDQTVSLDPAQQQLLDTQNAQDLALGQTGNAMLGQINSTIGQPMDTSGLPGLMGAVNMQQLGTSAGQNGTLNVGGPGIQDTLDTNGLPALYGADDLLGARQQTADALYRQHSSYLDPQYQQRDQALRTELANKGVTEGSEAWNRMQGDFERARSFDYSGARDSAITGSGAEMSRLADIAQGNRGQIFGERTTAGNFQNNAQAQRLAQALTEAGFANDANFTNASFANDATAQNNATGLMGAQFQNQARAQGLDEAYAARAQPLNEFSALRGATQVNVPQFSAAQNSTTNPADIAGYMGQNYQNQLQAYQQQMASRNAVISGLFGLGASAIGG